MTLYSEQPLSPREAYLNYLAALRGLGYTVVEVAGLMKVVPEADAKLQTGTVSIGNVTRSGDLIITQIFRLQTRTPTTWCRCCARSSAPTTPSTPTRATTAW
jgi:general secretion pathway protein D